MPLFEESFIRFSNVKVKNCNSTKSCKANFCPVCSFIFGIFSSSLCHMIESVVWQKERKRWRLASIFCRKKAEQRFHLNGRSDFRRRRRRRGREKKRTFFLCCIGPRKSPEAMRQKKSDLKRYFTIVVVVWYSTFFTKLYLINTAIHMGGITIHVVWKHIRYSIWKADLWLQLT